MAKASNGTEKISLAKEKQGFEKRGKGIATQCRDQTSKGKEWLGLDSNCHGGAQPLLAKNCNGKAGHGIAK